MENDLLRWFRATLPSHKQLVLGAGDDAAVINLSDGMQLVATTDMLMDGVDFHAGQHAPEQIGRKALAVNLSDLAAMAARPLAALASLCLPRHGGEQLAKRLYAGLLPLAEEFHCPIAGGDTNSWDHPLAISVTALGEVRPGREWRRSGARPSDLILVTGRFGGSILGRHLDFQPRIAEALWLSENTDVHAAIDVSDGLSLDLARLCESSGCGAVLDLAAIPVSSFAENLTLDQGDGITALEHALADGEDFELILAIPPEEAKRLLRDQPLDVSLTCIGSFVPEHGLWRQEPNDGRSPLTPRGWEHRLEP